MYLRGTNIVVCGEEHVDQDVKYYMKQVSMYEKKLNNINGNELLNIHIWI